MFAELAATVLFTPFVAFILLLIFGRTLLRKVADYFAIGMMAIALIAAVALFYKVMTSADAGTLADNPKVFAWDWMKIGQLNLTVGLLIDPLSAFMAVVVTGLATLVLVFSVFYLYGDTMYYKYFMFMNFFCFTMLGIVFSENIFMTFIFWELVGLGSYFLIGFWFYKPSVSEDHHYQELKAKHATGIDESTLSPAFAQKKAFVMNRVGDFGFISGVGIFMTVMVMIATGTGVHPTAELCEKTGVAGQPHAYVDQTQKALKSEATSGEGHTGLVSFTTLYKARALGAFKAVELNLFGYHVNGMTLLTIATILTFMGAMGKSAQFPLHTWLPDAMQGPTTGSSIIHAATMVAAGVYMAARIHPLLTEESMFFVAMIGGITAFIAASIATVQWDIKAVLAYSTISQLGYMMVGLGTNGAVESFGYSAGVAHLFTHAFFKCMLFLCAGSVIHACHHNQDMFKMGGLRKKLPLTFTAMLFGCFAIAGVPLFSGFFSKDAILVSAMFYGNIHNHWFAYVPYGLAAVTAVMTACYMFRMLLMTFTGSPKEWARYAGVHAQKPWGLGKVADLFGPPPVAPAGVDLAALEAAAHASHGHGHEDHGHDDHHAHDSHDHAAHGHDAQGHDSHDAHGAQGGHGHDAHGAADAHGAHAHATFVASALADETNRPGPFPYHPPEHDVSFGVRSSGLLAFFEAAPLAILALMTFGFWYSGHIGLPVGNVALPFFSAPESHVNAAGQDEESTTERVSWIERYIHRPRVQVTLNLDREAKAKNPSLAYHLHSMVDASAREGHGGHDAGHSAGHGEHAARPLPFESVALAADEAPAHEAGGAHPASEHPVAAEHPAAAGAPAGEPHGAAAAHGEPAAHATGPADELHSLHYIHEKHHAAHELAGLMIGTACVIVGIGLAFLFYWAWPRKGVSPHTTLTAGPLKTLWVFLANLWYFDAVYDRLVVGGGKAFAGLSARVDSGVIDQICVDGWGRLGQAAAALVGTFDMWVVDKLVDFWGWLVSGIGGMLRWVQTGKVQTYVFLSGLAIIVMVVIVNYFGSSILAYFQ